MAGTILIIEDDVDLGNYLRLTLEAQQFSVVVATTGNEGYAKLSPEVALVLLDVTLPDRNGVDVCAQIRKTHKKLPIILLTARGSRHWKNLGLIAGATEYITKPFTTEYLLERIAFYLPLASKEH